MHSECVLGAGRVAPAGGHLLQGQNRTNPWGPDGSVRFTAHRRQLQGQGHAEPTLQQACAYWPGEFNLLPCFFVFFKFIDTCNSTLVI